MKDDIRHSGVIDEIKMADAHVRVRILQSSACVSCKAVAYCSSTESKEKIIDVYNVLNITDLKVGDEVFVTASTSVATKALLWAFGGPFIILLCVLFTLVLLGLDESLSAILSIVALIPYYFLLYLLRDRFSRSISFSIEGH